MKYTRLILTLFPVALLSCDLGNDPDIGGTPLQAMCGEWWVQTKIDGKDADLGYHIITTSNTAANNTTDLQIDDHGLIEDLDLSHVQFVAKVDLPNLTLLKGVDLPNISGGSSVSLLEGKILKNAVKTASQITADSLHMKFELKSHPGQTIEYAGYRRTGFPEDEH